MNHNLVALPSGTISAATASLRRVDAGQPFAVAAKVAVARPAAGRVVLDDVIVRRHLGKAKVAKSTSSVGLAV